MSKFQELGALVRDICASSIVESASRFEISNAKTLIEFGLVREFSKLTTLDLFCEGLQEFFESIGFSNFSFDHSDDGLLGGLTTFPEKCVNSYKEYRKQRFDLLLNWAGQTENANEIMFLSTMLEWAAKAPAAVEPLERFGDVGKFFAACGFHDVCVIPGRSATGTGNCILLVGRKGRLPDHFRRHVMEHEQFLLMLPGLLEYMALRVAGTSLWAEVRGRSLNIGEAPLNLLTKLGPGDLTLNDAANELGISVHTANQHAASARRAFEAKTTTGAIHRAVRAKLIRD